MLWLASTTKYEFEYINIGIKRPTLAYRIMLAPFPKSTNLFLSYLGLFVLISHNNISLNRITLVRPLT